MLLMESVLSELWKIKKNMKFKFEKFHDDSYNLMNMMIGYRK